MIYKKLLTYFVFLVLLVLSGTSLQAQNEIADKGKKLFMANCARCHAANMVSPATGPALVNVQERWEDKGQLYAWIRNSQSLIASGESDYAIELYAAWAPTIMNSFENFTDEDISALLTYIDCKAAGECDVAAGEEGGKDIAAGAAAKKDDGAGILLWGVLVLLLLAVVMLARYIDSLNRLARRKAGLDPGAEQSVLEIILNPTIIRVLVFFGVILGGYTTVNNAINLGRQQGYAPEQPIKFSHAKHAGEYEIDCQYCHDGARRSKHAVIPGMNTCMNCHTNIQKGSTYGSTEILKIYASTGFNPTISGGGYFPDTLSAEKRLEVYEQWLKETALNDPDLSAEYKLNPKGVNADINIQLKQVAQHIGNTIEWTRVHNLPDHVYFNHSQHVTVGGLECETCHGPVETMEVVEQYAPLSMGWCVNCHRQTDVQFKDLEYYSKDYGYYEQYHQEIEEGKRTGVTVEEIGGLECQKCHY